MLSLTIALVSFVLPCIGHSVYLKDLLNPVSQPTETEKSNELATLLFALSGPVARSHDISTLGRSLGRVSVPRLQAPKVPTSFEEYEKMMKAREAKQFEEDESEEFPPADEVRGTVVSSRSAQHAARQAEARKALEEAARMTEQTAARASDLAARMDQASQKVAAGDPEDNARHAARQAAQAWAAAAKQNSERMGSKQRTEENEDDQIVKEKSLPTLVMESLTMPSAPSVDMDLPGVDARTARMYLPLLGVVGLAAGSVLTDEKLTIPSLPVMKEMPAPVKKAPAPVKEVVVPPPPPPPPKKEAIAPMKEVVKEVVATPATPPPLPRIDSREAEAALNRFFPGALDSLAMESKVAEVLLKRGYTNANTLFASSLCPDEVNAEAGDLVELMKSRWGENFGLGGLAGLPFVGKSGFTAYAHHVPDNGKLLVLFAPHVGINFDGKVGKLQRLNQKSVSTACGAAIGAYNGIMKEALTKQNSGNGVVTTKTRNDFDGQIEYIKAKLRPRLQGIENAPDEIAFISYQMYAIVREFLIDQVLTASGVWKDAGELCVVGGIMVNLGQGGDRFVPLFFQAREGEEGAVVDLYKDAFGNKPDLSYVLGDKAKAANFNNYDLKTLSMTSEDKLLKLFPGALDSATIDRKVGNTLAKYGYDSGNTLLATSTCPDEVNTKPGEFMELLKSRWGENFALGGLAGLPFVGKAGFSAYAHHVPDDGKLLVVFAPHVGIDFEGKVGALKRLNQKGLSTACGAAIGAYNGIIKEALDKTPVSVETPFKTGDAFDAQIEYIKAKLRARLGGIDTAPDPIAFITYQMYAIVREFVDEILASQNLFADASEVAILGGIQVNGDNGDSFMPLLFESKKGDNADINDLYVETFGYRPDISYALGDKAKAASFYKTDLRALS